MGKLSNGGLRRVTPDTARRFTVVFAAEDSALTGTGGAGCFLVLVDMFFTGRFWLGSTDDLDCFKEPVLEMSTTALDFDVLPLEMDICDFESEEMTMGPLSEDSEMISVSGPGSVLLFLSIFTRRDVFAGVEGLLIVRCDDFGCELEGPGCEEDGGWEKGELPRVT